MQEWLNWHAWKACRLFTGSPGFESPSFRQEWTNFRIVHSWRNSTTALEPILAQKFERRAGRRPAQPKNPPPFAYIFRDFPRRDFLEAEKGVVFRGLPTVSGGIIYFCAKNTP